MSRKQVHYSCRKNPRPTETFKKNDSEEENGKMENSKLSIANFGMTDSGQKLL